MRIRYQKIGNDFGSVERQFKSHGLRLAETTYPRCASTPKHMHDQSYLALVLNGDYRDQRANTNHQCSRDSVKFHRNHEYHACSYGTSRVCQFTIQWTQLDQLITDSNVVPCSTVSYESHISKLAYAIYEEFRRRQACPAIIQQLTKRLFFELFQRNDCHRRGDDWLQELKEFLVRNCERNWELSELARIFDRHPVYIAQRFKAFSGMTVGHFQRTAKINRAKKLLLEYSCPIVEIANLVGFADHSHFSKVFKGVVGCSPSQFRNKETNND